MKYPKLEFTFKKLWFIFGLTSLLCFYTLGFVADWTDALLFGPVFGALPAWIVFRSVNGGVGLIGGLYDGNRGAGKVGYSTEFAMAKLGQREEACAALLAKSEGGEPEALHALVTIASQRPFLPQWVAKACQVILKDEKLKADDRNHFERLLKESEPKK